ncbi:MAG: hypothetical protein VX725_02820 [Actinomycetota bacterium]|nr:hypothetical protein [Actinomycetota bacterium]
MRKLSAALFRQYRIFQIRLYMGSIFPAFRRFLTKTRNNIFNFGLGRRINFSAVTKFHVSTVTAQVLLNMAGGFIISLGATMVIMANLGATTTDVLLTGLSKQTGITIAGASFGLLVALFVVMGLTRSKIGIGTVVVPLSVSTTFIFSFSVLPEPHNAFAQLLYFMIGLFTIATGVGIAASAGIGMGAYESICHRVSEIHGWHPQIVRLSWELIVLAAGISLGGAFGPGTLIAAISTGWILQYMNIAIGDYLLGRRIRTNCQQPLARGYSYERQEIN